MNDIPTIGGQFIKLERWLTYKALGADRHEDVRVRLPEVLGKLQIRKEHGQECGMELDEAIEGEETLEVSSSPTKHGPMQFDDAHLSISPPSTEAFLRIPPSRIPRHPAPIIPPDLLASFNTTVRPIAGVLSTTPINSPSEVTAASLVHSILFSLLDLESSAP